MIKAVTLTHMHNGNPCITVVSARVAGGAVIRRLARAAVGAPMRTRISQCCLCLLWRAGGRALVALSSAACADTTLITYYLLLVCEFMVTRALPHRTINRSILMWSKAAHFACEIQARCAAFDHIIIDRFIVRCGSAWVTEQTVVAARSVLLRYYVG